MLPRWSWLLPSSNGTVHLLKHCPTSVSAWICSCCTAATALHRPLRTPCTETPYCPSRAQEVRRAVTEKGNKKAGTQAIEPMLEVIDCKKGSSVLPEKMKQVSRFPHRFDRHRLAFLSGGVVGASASAHIIHCYHRPTHPL